MSFEKEKPSVGGEVNRMLSRLEHRITAGKIEKDPAEQAVGKVVEGIVEAKKLLEHFDFNTASAESIAALTNAWSAWRKDGLFAAESLKPLRLELQELLKGERGANRYARQVWRTEMVSYISSKLQTSTRADKAVVMEKVMAAQVVTSSENDPQETLRLSASLDSKIRSKDVREGLAKEMAASSGAAHAKDMIDNHTIKEIKVLVGGELFSVPLELAKDFKFKHMVEKRGENRVYAQMENGCKGNLVIIELTPRVAAAPPPAPPPAMYAPPTAPLPKMVAPPPAAGVGPGRPKIIAPPAPPAGPKVAPPPAAGTAVRPRPAPPGAVPPPAPAPAPPPAPKVAPPPPPGVGPGRPKVAPPPAPPPAAPVAPPPAPKVTPPPAAGIGPTRAPAVAAETREKPSEEVAQIIRVIESLQDEYPGIAAIQLAAHQALDAIKKNPKDRSFAKGIFDGFDSERNQILEDLGFPLSKSVETIEAELVVKYGDLIEKVSLSQETARQFINDVTLLNLDALPLNTERLANDFSEKLDVAFSPDEIQPVMKDFIVLLRAYHAEIPPDWEPKSPLPKVAPPPAAPKIAPPPPAGAGPRKPAAAPAPAPKVAPPPPPGVGPGRPKIVAPPAAPPPAPGTGPRKPRPAPPGAVPPPPRRPGEGPPAVAPT